MKDPTSLPTRLPGVTLFHIIQHLNGKYRLALDVMFAIPNGDRSIYFHDPSSGSVAIFACFKGERPNLIFFCLKSQILLPEDLAGLNVEIALKFFPPGEMVARRNPLPDPFWVR